MVRIDGRNHSLTEIHRSFTVEINKLPLTTFFNNTTTNGIVINRREWTTSTQIRNIQILGLIPENVNGARGLILQIKNVGRILGMLLPSGSIGVRPKNFSELSPQDNKTLGPSIGGNRKPG